jgi:hypothetical protein
MNEDYAELLPDGQVDFKFFGRALNAVMTGRDHSQREVERLTGVAGKTIRTVLEGGRCNLDSGLKLFIYMDGNPFDALRVPDVSRENTTPAPCETGGRASG